MKKGLAFLLALTLVFQLAAPAFAETLPDETEGTTAVTEATETEPPATEAEPTEEPTTEATTETVIPTETTIAPTEATSATEEPSEETEATESTYALMDDSDVIASGACGADGDNLTWVLTGDGTLTISGNGEMSHDYNSYPYAPWYKYCRAKILSVVVELGVTCIGPYAFYDCSNLTSATIPDGVTSIGDNAFDGCGSLTSVTIPEGVTGIGESAFSRCSSLTSVTIPDSVTSIWESAFSGCSSLTSVTIPAGVTKIARHAFSGCYSLASILVDDNNTNYTSVDGVVFDKTCTTLLCYPAGGAIVYQIPEGVTSIGEYAFYCCSSLTSVTIPEGVTSIGEYAFSGCSSLASVIIPEGVTMIRRGTFAYAGVESITLPDGLQIIESCYDNYYWGDHFAGAFQGCNKLKNIIIPDSVTRIGDGTFRYCVSLTSVIVPGSVQSIGCEAFFGCTGLESVILLEGVSWIAGYSYSITTYNYGAFCDCSSLRSITIPLSLKGIYKAAFSSCDSLKDIYYAGNQKQWDSIEINSDGNKSLLNATLHLNSFGSDKTLRLTSTSPANGETDVSLESPLVLTFSHDISEELDWSKGKICILDSDSQRSVLEVGADEFAQLGGYVEGNKLVIPSAFETDWIRFSTSGKLTLLIPDELIYAVDANSGERVYYTGTRGDITFTVKRDIITTGFDLQKDAFSFSNEKYFFDKPYSYRKEDLKLLYSKISNAEKLMLILDLGSYLGGFHGMCFGMSSLMGLLQAGKLDITQIQSDAVDAADLIEPKENKTAVFLPVVLPFPANGSKSEYT